jgi:hypothetical protein
MNSMRYSDAYVDCLSAAVPGRIDPWPKQAIIFSRFMRVCSIT